MKIRLLILLFCVWLPITLKTQIKLYELKRTDDYKSFLLDKESTNRITLSLNNEWVGFVVSRPERKFKVNAPFYYEGEQVLALEKSFFIDSLNFKGKTFELKIFDLRGRAEIEINGYLIFKHTFGNYPIAIPIGEELLRFNENNKLTIKIANDIRNDEYFPNRRNFLAPKNYGGILGGVYFIAKPSVYINRVLFKPVFNYSKRTVDSKIKIEWIGVKSRYVEDAFYKRPLSIKFSIFDVSGKLLSSYEQKNLTFEYDEANSLDFEMQVKIDNLAGALNWPKFVISTDLFLGENLVDNSKIELSLIELNIRDNGLFLNDESFSLKIANYVPDVSVSPRFNSYEFYLNEFLKIKNAGFNAIHFNFFIPDPIALLVCDSLKLLVIGELPLNFIPSKILNEKEIREKIGNYIDELLNLSERYGNLKMLSLGNGYLFYDDIYHDFFKQMSKKIKQSHNILVLASFIDDDFKNLPELDFIGLECFNFQFEEIESIYEKASESLPKHKLIIGPISYPVFGGSSSGFLNKNTYEAQAKLWLDLLKNKKIRDNSFAVSSAYDYKGERQSLSVGFDQNYVYKIGIMPYNRNENERLVYKVFKWKLANGERITVPIGIKQDQTPMFFIYVGLALGIFIGIFLGIDRKLRIDCVRSLNRSYNFFADVRDKRIMTNTRLIFLSIFNISIISLITLNILYFYKNNNLLDKIALSFGRYEFFDYVFSIAWNPEKGFLILALSLFSFVPVFSLIVYLISVFKSAKTSFSYIYFAYNWAIMPMILFLPLGIILFKVLSLLKFNYYLFTFLGLIFLWIIQRTLKATYILLYENPAKVYIWFLLILTIIVVPFFVYLDLKESLFAFFELALKTSTF